MKRRKSNSGTSASEPARVGLRREIAYLAARLVSEDGITDFAAAKRKAARQLGVTESSALPDNREIDAALRAHQAIFQTESQPQECRALREMAAEIMRRLDRFSPWLVGGVLTGTANRYSPVELEIIADDAKQLEMFFLAADVAFDIRVKKTRSPKRKQGNAEVSAYEVLYENVTVVITVYPRHDARFAQHSPGSLYAARAQLAALERLLAERA